MSRSVRPLWHRRPGSKAEMAFRTGLIRLYMHLRQRLHNYVKDEIDARLVSPILREVPEDWVMTGEITGSGCYFPGTDRRPQTPTPYTLLIPRHAYLQE